MGWWIGNEVWFWLAAGGQQRRAGLTPPGRASPELTLEPTYVQYVQVLRIRTWLCAVRYPTRCATHWHRSVQARQVPIAIAQRVSGDGWAPKVATFSQAVPKVQVSARLASQPAGTMPAAVSERRSRRFLNALKLLFKR
jgi:hypothetical protein